MRKIGIVILASNAYFPLGIRFMNRFNHYYVGNHDIYFHFFSNNNPLNYLKNSINCKYHPVQHKDWVEAVESKFDNVLSLDNEDLDYLYFFDADTNIKQPFEDWFVGDMVGTEHFGNNTWMKDRKDYDRYENSSAYIPLDTPLPQMYYMGCCWGGTKENMFTLCRTIKNWQEHNKALQYEPGVNDESYLNKYYHYNPPSKVVPIQEFKFVISDKGSIDNTRNPLLDVKYMNKYMFEWRESLWDIKNSVVVKEKV